MPTSARWEAANSPKSSVKSGAACGRTESSAPTGCAGRTASEFLSCLKLRGKSPEKPKGFSGRFKGAPGGNRNPPGPQIANQRSICNLKRRKRTQRIRGFVNSGDSFRRGRFRRAAFSFGEAKENAVPQLQICRSVSALCIIFKFAFCRTIKTPPL